ncbi:MFS transporter [Streptomyces albofaciens JCM 4342]|uniref:MFS transporter n=1 Tax=Streptomyces albofaciens TaxID=66866 RepID=UPI00123AB6DC|nr:MFS transporter [Streptomyces albofaciens]KAA6223334.1 MFS transporter [Streptomyces albofaciens JCM 4342]
MPGARRRAAAPASGFGRPAAPSLWRDRDFRRLWAGQAASQFGERSSQVVLPLIAVLALDADAMGLGVLRAVEQAPVLLLSLFVGAWVDRRRSRDVMVLADLGRAVAPAVVLGSYLLGVLGMPTLVVAAFLIGVLSVFFDVAYQTSLVRLVRRDQLARGNSALEGSRSAAQTGGPALGGALASLLPAPFAAAACAFFFALSFLSIRGIRRREPIPEHAGRPARVRHRIHEGLRLVFGHPVLRAVCLASAAFQFFFAAMMTVYLLFLPRGLHLSATAVGLALAATGPGAVVGSLLSARLPMRYGYGVVLMCSAVLADGVLLCVPALHGPSAVTVLVLVAVNFLFGACGQLVNVTMMSVRQAVTPVPVQGRVVATVNCVGMGLAPLGSLLGGRLADQWGLRTALLVTVVGLSLSPLCMALSPLARLGKDFVGSPSPPVSGTTPA